eukprot:Rmarinus@m.22435
MTTTQRTLEEIQTMNLYHDVDRIYNELREIGKENGPLLIEDLVPFDQYHYCGTESVDEALKELEINMDSTVLDFGSGIGGPARYMAEKTGGRVVALELQKPLDTVAKRLTERCDLKGGRVDHFCGDILDQTLCLPVPDQGFQVIVSWLVVLHIPERVKLFKRCYELLRPGGKLYLEDFYGNDDFTVDELAILKESVYCHYLPTKSVYCQQLQEAGFTNIEFRDRTTVWANFVRERAIQYREATERNIRVHGAKVVNEQQKFYDDINLLFQGHLRGACVVASK